MTIIMNKQSKQNALLTNRNVVLYTTMQEETNTLTL